MAIRNPFDQIILDDPAYAEEIKIDPQAGKKLTRDIYGLILGEEDPYANKKLERELSVALAQKEAGLPVDPNKSFVTSAERQDPILGPALKKFDYESMGLGEVGERSLEFLYRDQLKAREKQLRGEELSFGEKIAANPFMAALDATDFTGLIGLATKGGIKLSAKGLQTLNNLRSQGASKEVINQIMTTQFPDDAQKIGLVYYQTNRPPGMETSQLLNKADDGGSSMPKGLQIGHDINSARRLESKNKLLKVINDAKQSGKKYKQKLDIYKEAGISKFVGKTLGDEFAEIRQDTDFLINKPDKSNKDVVLDFLKQDPNKKYTIKEIAESTGLGYQQVNKVKEMNRTQIGDRFVSPKDEGTQRRNDMREYLNNIPEGSYVPSDFLAEEFKTTANEVGVFLQNDPQYRNKVRMANTFDFGFDRGFETVPQFLMKYMDDTMNDGRFHYRDEILDVDFNGNKISNKQLSAFFQNYKDYKKYFAPTEFQQKGKGRDIPRVLNENKQELGYTAVGSGPRRAEYNFLYDYLRSADPNLYPDFKGSKAEFYQMLVDDLKSKNWKELYREDINTIRELDILREQGTQKIKNLFETYSEQYPQQFKNLDKGDFVLHLAHNFPLQLMRDDFGFAGSLKGSTRLSLARTNLEHHREIEDEIAKIVKEVNQKYVDKGVGPQTKQKIPPEINKKLAELDKKANKLGTVVYFKFGNQQYKVGNETPPSVDDLVNATEKYFQYVAKQSPGYKPKKTDKNFGDVEIPVGAQKEGGDVDTLTKAKGGAVKMARGGIGDPLQNINQQQFTPDPAIDGDSAFQQAVKSENLYAFNPAKIIKFFGDKVPGVFTPSKRNKNMELMSDAPSAPGTTLPVEQPIQDYDFAFKSFTLDKVNSKNAPKAAKPQDWINFLQGGDVAPKAEILDSGLFQYMEDFERYYPNQKITREQITDFYEQSPIANLQVKVKTDRDGMTPYGPQDQQVMGIAKHKNAGNARIDEGGENYREIVIEAGALPGEEKPFVSSGHYQEPNVLVFSRVADYKNVDGQNVSVIQEMQTDLLTKVRKEQERLAATIGEAKVKLAANQRVIETGDQYQMENATQNIRQLSQQIPKLEQLAETKLIKPYPLTVAKELIPTYEKQMLDLQQEINALAQAGVDRTDPEFLMKINQIEQQQQGTLNELLNLNRSSNFESLTEGIKVPTTNSTEELQQIAQNQSSYHGTRNIETFPPIPFNNQADYVDLILKATIKDAENRGINKIAIMPADVGANPRWSKTSDDARKKFQNLYDKVGVQQLKNIAKKYGGNVEIEKISDPNKSTMGLKVSKPSLNRDSFDFLKDVDVDRRAVENDPEGVRNFLDEEIVRIASDLGDKNVIYRKETAPGQTMDYYVKVLTYPDEKGSRFRLDPLKDGDVDTDAQILIEDYNPSLVDMFVLTMDEGKQKAPMYMFKKKEGGIIPEDRLVSITDIYGDY